MPEMTFRVQWPDGHEQSCYSPSLVIHDYLTAGEEYSVTDFLERTRTALTEASERVKAKFGMYCTSAAEQLHELEKASVAYSPTSAVRVLSMTPDTISGGIQ
ncbi:MULTISPECIES: MSMEG_0570 family nitrogen starvation response protein [unclassified Rhodococcus (in: high G+C Gram-positive bacteria)]|uniref:MSMEG_0570 family nitrogen starvation response protein n=1 Tax=unclassified Rhodococcus (in: high G+C Gram-positive bacteria) TaxID=192944 RepID=UPI0016394F2B|nr:MULTISPECIES: MSMEG_0570 family nitrogen starvation response protein [unclassified Rhodococcus (in: high G+C Gram-positive bacteria)]MBC2638163.1 MSMEG_0570 family nitrogen starvation response protein [Rhodococcus sp. 3A]MBC2897094.1 MSMEG_0570 family nitrogen starvation response protein [Rhodococcus sp. 4CII]